MTHFGVPYVYLPTAQPVTDAVLTDDVGAYVLSDYPAANFSSLQMDRLCARVRAGAGVLMLGGWESYHGLAGYWHQTPLADLLPVIMRDGDDRRNSAQPILARARAAHEILAGLPWDQPPAFGGYNEFEARPGAAVLLEGERYRVRCDQGPAEFVVAERFPLLVVEGRRVCLATDVAPHWVGGWVDWGDERLAVRFGEDSIEVGNWYARFFRNLVLWCLGEKRNGA
jgi:uncharacterized membrane protein